MLIFVIAACLFFGALFALAAFARGGKTESTTSSAGAFPSALDAGGLLEVMRSLLSALDFTVERADKERDGSAFVASNGAPITGQRIYVRTYARPNAERVGEAEVQSAIDTVHGEGLSKALLVSTSGFSDEALLAAAGTPVELIDGTRLSELLARYTSLVPARAKIALPRSATAST